MARLLVASRSMALAMRITDDHDVVEYPVERLDELAPGKEVDAVVLDLGEPAAAMQALERLRAQGLDTRVLIVSGYQPAWNELVDVQIDRVVVVPLPITRAALLDGIDQLLGKTPRNPRVKRPSRPTTPPRRSREPARPLAPPLRPEPTSSSRPAPVVPPDKRVVGVMTPPDGEPVLPDADPPGGTPPQDAEKPPSRRRPGLSRWLANGAERPSFTPPAGSPLQASRQDAPPHRTTQPDTTSPPVANLPPDTEQNLFRPVVEPQVPSRSPSQRPRQPVPPTAAPPRTSAAAPQSRTASTPPLPTAPPAAPPAGGARRPPLSPTRPAERAAPPTEPPRSPIGRAQPSVPPPISPGRPGAPARSAPESSPPDLGASGQSGFGRGRLRRDRTSDRHPGFTPAPGLRPAEAERAPDVHTWVRGLLDRRSELFGVAETAQVLADEVVERGESDAAAVLVPDGDTWRVSGGVGLRPVERRLVLDTSHWLIFEIAVGGRALLIEDTDIVRPRLAGAPLAAWRHLLAVPVPGLRAAVVLARGQDAARFTEQDLAAVVPVVAEASPLLTAALQMRELARVLAPLRDVEGER